MRKSAKFGSTDPRICRLVKVDRARGYEAQWNQFLGHIRYISDTRQFFIRYGTI